MMKELYPPKVRKAAEALMTQSATTSTALRQATEAHAAALNGATRQVHDFPPELVKYVDKVALHAYKVMDNDVQRLKEAGYSEDAIFEITLCASLGAGLARLERGLLALKGGN